MRAKDTDKIARQLHLLWLDGPGERTLPASVATAVASWRAHGGVPVCVWERAEVWSLLGGEARLSRGDLEACRSPAEQGYLIRLYLVLAFGGFASDLENHAVRAMPDALFERRAPVFVINAPASPTPQITDALFGAPRGSPLLAEALRSAVKAVRRREGRGAQKGPGAGAADAPAASAAALREVLRAHAATHRYDVLPRCDVWEKTGEGEGFLRHAPHDAAWAAAPRAAVQAAPPRAAVQAALPRAAGGEPATETDARVVDISAAAPDARGEAYKDPLPQSQPRRGK